MVRVVGIDRQRRQLGGRRWSQLFPPSALKEPPPRGVGRVELVVRGSDGVQVCLADQRAAGPRLGPVGRFDEAEERGVAFAQIRVTAGKEVVGAHDGEYRYRGTDPDHHENVGLRRAMRRQLPLVYFHGVSPGWYRPEWPVFIVGDDPDALTFTVAMEDPQVLRPDLTVEVVDDARRSYVTRLARQRLHQLGFRHRVLTAYRQSCTVCRLRHVELLDAAHILPDSHPLGEPLVTNGLAMCKLHHAAFDRHIVGIRPDLVLAVRHDVLEEERGPMLRHGLQELEGAGCSSYRPGRSSGPTLNSWRSATKCSAPPADGSAQAR